MSENNFKFIDLEGNVQEIPCDVPEGNLKSDSLKPYLEKNYKNYCNQIISVEVPKNIKKLCSDSLSLSMNLKGIVIPNSIETLEPNVFSSLCKVEYVLIEKNELAEKFKKDLEDLGAKLIKDRQQYEKLINEYVK